MATTIWAYAQVYIFTPANVALVISMNVLARDGRNWIRCSLWVPSVHARHKRAGCFKAVGEAVHVFEWSEQAV